MIPVYTGKMIRSLDRSAIEDHHMPSAVLMERAALETVRIIKDKYKDAHHILSVAGPGNNGGDAVACARILKTMGFETAILKALPEKELSYECERQMEIAKSYDIPFIDDEELITGYDVIIDGIFGTGLKRPVEGRAGELIQKINNSNIPVVSLDIPSGISSDNGSILGYAIDADVTVTFGFLKDGIVLEPGRTKSGRVYCVDVGISDDGQKSNRFILEDIDIERMMPSRISDSNKGTYGKALIIAGSSDYAGAAYFAARAALLSGAGLVYILTDESNRNLLLTRLPEAIVITYSGRITDERLDKAMAGKDSIVLGPGLSRNSNAEHIVKYVVSHSSVPTVIDADALNIISDETEILMRPHVGMVLTPHIGEMARLVKKTMAYVKSEMTSIAESFSRDYQVDVVLKSAVSVISIPQGHTYYNVTGNDGLSTGGTGDILSGIIGGLMAQRMRPGDAAAAASYLLGKAGEKASEGISKRSVTASSVLDALPEILL